MADENQPAGGDLLSPKARKIGYVTFGLVGIGLGTTQVGFLAAGTSIAEQPVALTVAIACYTYLGGAFGFVARSFVGR